MVRSGYLPAVDRRALVALVLAVALGATTGARAASGSAPQQQQQPPAGQPAADPFQFSHDGPFIMVWTIKPDRADGFEKAWLSIKDALGKSTNAEHKAFGDNLTIYRVSAPPAAGQPVVFVFQMNPPSKTMSYNPVKILFEYLKAPTPTDAAAAANPPAPPPGTFSYDEAMTIFKLLEGANEGVAFWPLQKKG
jgi:hypothetical protein